MHFVLNNSTPVAQNLMAQVPSLPAPAAQRRGRSAPLIAVSGRQSVFCTGGGSSLRGFRERLYADLVPIRPFQSVVNVYRAGDPVLDAWRGASLWAVAAGLGPDAIAAVPSVAGVISRRNYEEMGAEYLSEHACSNRYFPTPQSG